MTTKQRVKKIEQAIIAKQPANYDELVNCISVPKNWGFGPHWDNNFRIKDISFYDGKNRNCVMPMPPTINIYVRPL